MGAIADVAVRPHQVCAHRGHVVQPLKFTGGVLHQMRTSVSMPCLLLTAPVSPFPYPGTRKKDVSVAVRLPDAAALDRRFIQFDPQAGGLGNHQAAVLQRGHSLQDGGRAGYILHHEGVGDGG